MQALKPLRHVPPQELRDCTKDTETSGLHVELVDERNLLHWKGRIKGPVGTPYEGGQFQIDIVLPSDYPFVPPKARPQTRRTAHVFPPPAGLSTRSAASKQPAHAPRR